MKNQNKHMYKFLSYESYSFDLDMSSSQYDVEYCFASQYVVENNDWLGNHVNDQAKKVYSQRLTFSTSDGIHIIDVEEIVRLEAYKNYTEVYLLNNQKLLVSKTLKTVEGLLDPKRFLRIHKSHTVDIQKVIFYYKGKGGSLKMVNGDKIPVSKQKRVEVLDAISII